MAREQSFLDRVEGGLGGAGRGPTTTEDVHEMVESVRRNLVRLLNSRHGMSLAQPDYGLPAISDLSFSGGNTAATVREAVRAAIEKYEPRLRRVRVVSEKDEDGRDRQTLTFRVEAVLVGRSGEHRVWYETSLTGAGEFDVSG
ncbi:MAG: type VI secretion system baseplate subunit TssE [Phycisphaerae bacterium]|jgi:type VI secretion system protein